VLTETKLFTQIGAIINCSKEFLNASATLSNDQFCTCSQSALIIIEIKSTGQEIIHLHGYEVVISLIKLYFTVKHDSARMVDYKRLQTVQSDKQRKTMSVSESKLCFRSIHIKQKLGKKRMIMKLLELELCKVLQFVSERLSRFLLRNAFFIWFVVESSGKVVARTIENIGYLLKNKIKITFT
ncbi:unnamed protein product, partial [Enterobius vermicularis]|uniref:Secreted protein n=1 Tax=Enterobius vermicularis TaxID=51028 RepID=A0A0N4VIM9_ENTVE